MITITASTVRTHIRLLNERKRKDYQAFLNASNGQAALFRDIIIEAQYDPLAVNKRAIKARVGKLQDPTRRVIDRCVKLIAAFTAALDSFSMRRSAKTHSSVELVSLGLRREESCKHQRFHCTYA